MKLKILLKIVEKIFGVTMDDDRPRADMYLPLRLLAMSLVFLAAGIACGIYAVITLAIWWGVGAAAVIALGIFALICWKNQAIRIISDEQFTYTTMFGNTRTYAFSDIQGLRRNQDSMTLLVAGQKVHIESMAVISDRLANAINIALTPAAKFIKSTTEELSKLSDEELFSAVWVRAENRMIHKGNLQEGFRFLNEEQRVFYAVNYLEAEVNNGGLCQFFVNSSRMVAPFVGEYMGIIGAVEHQKLYEDFIRENRINTRDLSSFDSETLEVFQSQYERYPFEEFDDAFYKLESLQKYLMPYVREHIEKF